MFRLRDLEHPRHGDRPMQIKAAGQIIKWGGALLLLFVEVAALQLWFSVPAPGDGDSLVARLIYYSTYLPGFVQILVPSVATSLLLFGGRRLWAEVKPTLERRREWTRLFLILLVHIALFGAFVWMTRVVVEGGSHPAGPPVLRVILWVLAGTAAFGSWCLIVFPPDFWSRLFGGFRWESIGGLAIGSAAYIAEARLGQLWQSLAGYTFQSVYWLLHPLYPDLVCDPLTRTLGTAGFKVIVGVSCSGFEGMGLVSIFLAVYLGMYRDEFRFPQAFLLFPIGLASMWVTNAFRLASLIVLGTRVSAEVAMGGFHSQAGWLAFNAVALGLIVGAGRMRFFTRTTGPPAGTFRSSPSAAYLAPLMAGVAAGMVTTAVSAGFDWLYPVRVVAIAGVLWFFRASYGRARWSWSWPAAALGTVAAVLWLLVARRGGSGNADTADSLSQIPTVWSAFWVSFRVLGYVVATPVAEELAFRGYLLRRFVSARFLEVQAGRIPLYSFVISSLLFGAVHGRNWLPGTLAGLLFGWAFCLRGKTSDAIQAHAVTNTLIAVYVLVTRDWTRWS